MEVETEVVLTGSFLEYVKNAFPEDIVIKKLKQLELYDIVPLRQEDLIACEDSRIKQIIY